MLAQSLIEFLKEFLVPGSTWFLMIVCSAAAALLFSAGGGKAGRWLLAIAVSVYWIISVPIVAQALQRAQRSVERVSAALPSDPLPIVVLGNGLGGYAIAGARFELPLGQTAMNTLFAVERYRQTPAATVIASGGRQPYTPDGQPEALVIRYGLLRNGVPADRVIVESQSANTHDQAINVSRLLKARGETRCVLVTSPQQMPRALALFRAEGVSAIPLTAKSQLWAPAGTTHWWAWLVPSAESRAVSRDVAYEWMAWPYYRVRGWVN